MESREQIFASAMKEFDARGIEDSRVEAIVAEAGASWGSFFRYFPRKEDVLLHAAARHFHSVVLPVFNAGMSDPDKTAWDLGHEILSALTEPEYSPGVHAAMIDEMVRNPARFSAILDYGDFPVIRLFEGMVSKGMGTGEIRADVNPVEAATVFGAGVIFPTTRVLSNVAQGTLQAVEIRAIAGRAFDLVWRGIGNRD